MITRIERKTDQEIIDNLEFNVTNNDGKIIVITNTQNQRYFESNLKSWLDLRVSEDWNEDESFVILKDEDGDETWLMTAEEYRKLCEYNKK